MLWVEAINEKQPESDSTDLVEVSQRDRKLMGLPLHVQMLVTAISGSLFYHKDTGAGKHYFGALHIDYLPPAH